MPRFSDAGEIVSDDGAWRWLGDRYDWERIGPAPSAKPGALTRLFVKEENWGKPGRNERHQAEDMFRNRKELLLTERANKLLADDILTADEEQEFLAYAKSLGENLNHYPELLKRIVIANANAGRFPQAAPPYHVIPKPGEEIYMEAQASLMKEVADRQWQSGSSGVSFRVAKGVRFRTGSTRGHMVEVGTKLVEKDSGVLSITSTRVVFSGRTTTQESLYSKIENITVYNDGIALAVRRGSDITTRLYSCGGSEMMAAVINGAMQPHVHEEAPALAPSALAPRPPPGLLSPDGKFRWDGSSWQPVESS